MFYSEVGRFTRIPTRVHYAALICAVGSLFSSRFSAGSLRLASHMMCPIERTIVCIMALKLKSGEITKIEYDQWRYRYPELDTTGQWVKIPSEELSEAIVKDLRKD